MKRGNTYSVRYTYTDHHGKPCQGWVSFETTKKKRKIIRFSAFYLVHLQGLEPWAH